MSNEQQMELFQKAIGNPSIANLNKRQRALAEDVIARALLSPVSVRTVMEEARTNLLNNDIYGEDRQTAMAVLVSLERSQTDSVVDGSADGLRIIDPSNSPPSPDEMRESLLLAAEEAHLNGNHQSQQRILGLIISHDAEQDRLNNDDDYKKQQAEQVKAESDQLAKYMADSEQLAERAKKVNSGESVTYDEAVANGTAPTQTRFQRQR